MKAILLGLGLLLLSVTGALALDCAAPASDTIAVICTSPDAMAAVSDVDTALAETLKLVDADAAKALSDDQAGWLDGLASLCAYDEDGNELAADALLPCLIDEIRARRIFLSGAPLEGPGAPEKLVPVVLIGSDGTLDYLTRFADPRSEGAKAFNLEMDAALETIQIGKTDDDYTDYIDVTITYASPKLISARVELAYLGPQYAHPMPSVYGFAIDLTTGKKLTTDDAFTPGTAVVLADLCATQNADYIAAGEEGADQRRGNLDFMAKDISNWHFGATAATAEYLDYFLESPVTCTLSYDLLRPLLKAGFPLPD